MDCPSGLRLYTDEPAQASKVFTEADGKVPDATLKHGSEMPTPISSASKDTVKDNRIGWQDHPLVAPTRAERHLFAAESMSREPHDGSIERLNRKSSMASFAFSE